MAVFRTIIWFLYFFGALVLMLPQMYRAKRLKAAGQTEELEKILERCVHRWLSRLMKLAGCDVRVRGLENIPKDQPVVFFSNHQSNFDVPITMLYLGCLPAMVAKIETKKIPMVRTWMELLDCMFIDRSNPWKAMEAMRSAKPTLQSGRSIVAFPEGTRSQGDQMNEFHAGVFRIPISAGVPIVPVAIDGSYRIMEANHNLMRPGVVNLTILPPIETAALDREAKKALPQQVAAMIDQARQNRP